VRRASSRRHLTATAAKAGLAFIGRYLLTGLGIVLVFCAPLAATVHDRIGAVKPPVPVPDVSVVTSDGQRAQLRDLLVGRASAIQLMFTRCRSTCPIEAAAFARIQERLANGQADGIMLLSLSIDPVIDTPEALKAWLERFGARRGWSAAAPSPTDLATVQAFFDRTSGLGEDHPTAMYLVDQRGLLVWRTSELPEPDYVAELLTALNHTPLPRP
jgi:protein SCO1